MVTWTQYRTEQKNLARLKETVDRLCQDIIEAKIQDEACLAARVEEVRELCQKLFPDRMDLFEMIYHSRFKRLWEQHARPGP